jgi:hypothetical protein
MFLEWIAHLTQECSWDTKLVLLQNYVSRMDDSTWPKNVSQYQTSYTLQMFL